MTKTKALKTVSQTADDRRPQYFPCRLKTGIEVVPVSREEFFPFLRANFSKVFGRAFMSRVQPTARQQKANEMLIREYNKIHTEYFHFKKGGKVVGWSFGEMDDFETFYMRNTGLLPKYQNQGSYREFLRLFLEYIESLGYSRVSSQHHPNNGRIISLKMQEGFMVVGTENHERFGQLLKLVKIFDRKREAIFKKMFL